MQLHDAAVGTADEWCRFGGRGVTDRSQTRHTRWRGDRSDPAWYETSRCDGCFPAPQIYEDWMGGNLNNALLFRGLQLHFSACDSWSPLPYSSLSLIIIQGRPDAYLFDRPITEWTREGLLMELRARGYYPSKMPNGDVEVDGQLCLSFADDGQHIRVEV